MIQLIVEIDSSPDGKTTGVSRTRIVHKDTSAVEVTTLWAIIRPEGFQRDVKALLKEFCADSGFDSAKLLT